MRPLSRGLGTRTNLGQSTRLLLRDQLASGFWPQLGANASGNSTAVIQEKLYVRSFAPWYSFGPDPYSNKYPWNLAPCVFDCFLGDNRAFTTAVGPGVTSRINGSVRLLFPDMQPILAQAYSNLTTAIYRVPRKHGEGAPYDNCDPSACRRYAGPAVRGGGPSGSACAKH
jgi:hypothetical protein